MITRDRSSIIETPIGKLRIITQDACLLGISFVSRDVCTVAPGTPFAQKVVDQLAQYFQNACFMFDIPMQECGTTFQHKVRAALQAIPVGETRTYGALAQQLQTSPRAVGNACRQNPFPIVIPCHRVVAQGHVGGFAGQTDGSPLAHKKWLLNHEGC